MISKDEMTIWSIGSFQYFQFHLLELILPKGAPHVIKTNWHNFAKVTLWFLGERYIASSTNFAICCCFVFTPFICIVTTLQSPSFGFGTGCAIYPERQRMGPDPAMLAGKGMLQTASQTITADHWAEQPPVLLCKTTNGWG